MSDSKNIPEARAELSPCCGCGQLTSGMCWTDCGMSLCGASLCGDCCHINEKFGWRHEPRAKGSAPSAPAEVEGLVERLRVKGRMDREQINHHIRRMEVERIEAATALTALQAQNERLRARAEKAEAELAKIVEGIADDATAIPEACGKLHDLLCLPDGAKPSTAYDWAREAYDLLIPVSGRAIDRAARTKLKGDV